MVARGRAMNMQTSTRPREHKQCADNPDAAQLLPNFAERERDLQVTFMNIEQVQYESVTEQECITVQEEKCETKYDTVQVRHNFQTRSK